MVLILKGLKQIKSMNILSKYTDQFKNNSVAVNEQSCY